jgi:photosystem II stability/assembly factor-like uncharacterized protein
MSCKPYWQLSLIVLSMFILVACSNHGEVVLLPSPTHTQVPLAKPKSTPTIVPNPSATMDVHQIDTPWPTATSFATFEAGQTISITNLQMFDKTTGWAIEATGHIVRTTDGGDNWGNVTPPQGSYTDGGFFALDDVTAWATPTQGGCGSMVCTSGGTPSLTSATVWHTTNGGKNWETSQPLLLDIYHDMGQDSVPYYEPIAIQFVTDQIGWLLVRVNHLMMHDHLALFKTEDGGVSWARLVDEQHHTSSSLPCNADSLVFVNSQTGWMGGNCLNLAAGEKWDTYRTTDGGHIWNRFALPTPPDLPAEFTQNYYECGSGVVTHFPAGLIGVQEFCRVYYADDDYHGYGYYYFSADGGQTWRPWQRSNIPEFVNANMGWRLVILDESQSNELQQTLDGGITWTTLKLVSWQEAQFDFVNELIGWAIVTNGDVFTLLHTTDGGKTWVDLHQR